MTISDTSTSVPNAVDPSAGGDGDGAPGRAAGTATNGAAAPHNNGEPRPQPAAASPAPSLLDSVFAATDDQARAARSPLDELLAARTFEETLAVWIRHSGLNPEQLSGERIARRLNREVARIDALVSRQLNVILHQPRVQKLEASWRGLRYLVDQVEDEANVKIRVLNVSWQALVRDLDRSIEFDQSQLFRKVYSEEFGNPGGEPFSVLLGDYEIRPRPSPGCPVDDLQSLKLISQVAAAAFCPFIATAHPSLLGLNTFPELQRPMNIGAVFEEPEYLKWRALRDSEDARFVGLVLPRILLRLPWRDDSVRRDGFRFVEDCAGPGLDGYLWGTAGWAFGSVLLRAFAQSGWPADIHGVRRDLEDGGLVTGLPAPSFHTDRRGVALKSSTDAMITDLQEKDLAEVGLMALCPCKESPYSAFYSTPSIQNPKAFDREEATTNARISSRLEYMLCVCRLAHYLKVMGRDKVGSYAEAEDCERFLNDWLVQYVSQDDDAPSEIKARFPLRDARAQVREQPGRPGSYSCTIHLQPHYQLEGMVTAVKLTTELAPAG
jgi:type VI secretion system ImpC/EvpB family protein